MIYDDTLKEYEVLKHMKKCPLRLLLTMILIITKHAVFKPDSVTTKLQMVFNASNQTSSEGNSNDVFYSDPNLQTD